MDSMWNGTIVKSEPTTVADYTIPDTINVIRSEFAIHYQVETKQGLIIEFWWRCLDSFTAPDSGVIRLISHPIKPIYKVGEVVTVAGKTIKACAKKIIIECTEITEEEV